MIQAQTKDQTVKVLQLRTDSALASLAAVTVSGAIGALGVNAQATVEAKRQGLDHASHREAVQLMTVTETELKKYLAALRW